MRQRRWSGDISLDSHNLATEHGGVVVTLAREHLERRIIGDGRADVQVDPMLVPQASVLEFACDPHVRFALGSNMDSPGSLNRGTRDIEEMRLGREKLRRPAQSDRGGGGERAVDLGC